MGKLGGGQVEARNGTAGAGGSARPRLSPLERTLARQELQRSLELLRDQSATHPGEGLPGGGTLDMSPLERTVGREAVRRYESALARLRARDREAVRGRIELQRSYAELASALGVTSEHASRSVVTRALGRLFEAMRA